jgi:hypothetical protein
MQVSTADETNVWGTRRPHEPRRETSQLVSMLLIQLLVGSVHYL